LVGVLLLQPAQDAPRREAPLALDLLTKQVAARLDVLPLASSHSVLPV
jgi:hypothetical protein